MPGWGHWAPPSQNLSFLQTQERIWLPGMLGWGAMALGGRECGMLIPSAKGSVPPGPSLTRGHLVWRAALGPPADPMLMDHHVLEGALLHDHLLLLPSLFFIENSCCKFQPCYLLRGHVIQMVGSDGPRLGSSWRVEPFHLEKRAHLCVLEGQSGAPTSVRGPGHLGFGIEPSLGLIGPSGF